LDIIERLEIAEGKSVPLRMENYLWKGFFVSQIARGSAVNRASIGLAAIGLNYVADCANWTREDSTKEMLNIMK